MSHTSARSGVLLRSHHWCSDPLWAGDSWTFMTQSIPAFCFRVRPHGAGGASADSRSRLPSNQYRDVAVSGTPSWKGLGQAHRRNRTKTNQAHLGHLNANQGPFYDNAGTGAPSGRN